MNLNKRYFFTVCFILISAICAAQQKDLKNNTTLFRDRAGFISEGFENVLFPPSGWQVFNVTGFRQWTRVTSMAHSGQACAMIDYEPTIGEDWLITPQYSVSSGDTLSFFLRLNYAGWIPDSLAIRVSTGDSVMSSFTDLIMLLQDGVNYPAPGTWQKYSISLAPYIGQNIYIAFKHADANGDGIYLDDVFIGAVPPNDVSTTAISISNTMVNQSQNPAATVYNNGTTVQSFNVRMDIDGGYSSIQTVNSLMPGAYANVTFAPWTPTTGGMLNASVYTLLNPDAIITNDTMRTIVFVQGLLENYGWISKDLIPKALVGAGTCFHLDGYLPTDTGYIYVIGGNDLNTNSSTVLRYNTKTTLWDSVAPVPSGRLLASAVTVKNKIYYIGGYNPSYSPQNKTYIYDIADNIWSTGPNMITAVGDYAIGVYKDSLIYIIGGWAGMADINNVQIYNTTTNLWSSGSPKIGTATDGLRGGIFGNKIVVTGGTNQGSSSTVSSTLIGEINPADPTNIIWSPGPDYPFGAVTRAASGVPYAGIHSMVLFTGGEINGSTGSAYAGTCAYDFDINSWVIGPDKITPVNIVNDFPGIILNDTIYNVVVSGFDATYKTWVNEWLNLGSSGIVVSDNNYNAVFKTIDLRQNYPNPCHDQTVIPYFISQAMSVNITVMDQFGRVVKEFNETNATAGYHEIKVDMSDFANGIYFYRLITSKYSETLKMVKF